MRLFLAVILTFSLVGCATFGGRKPSSNWATLDDASAVGCSVWPHRDKDLGLREIYFTGTSLPLFLVSGVDRAGGPFHYALPFTQDTDVDVERARNMTLGRGAVLVGGTVFGNKAYAVVAQPKGAKSSLEVRSVPDNVVRYEFDIGAGDVAEGTIEQVGGAAWLLLQRDGGDVTLYRLGFAKGKFSGKTVTGLRWRDRPQLVPAGAKGGVFAVSREAATFKVRYIAADGTAASRAADLDVKPQSEIESWAVGKARQGGSYYLAFVDGDSLVGLSSLKVANFSAGDDGNANINWTRENVLKDVHVGEPVFHEVGGQLEVLLLNWVDEESTIARYQVSPAGLGKPKFSGIFPKGSRISLGVAAKDDLFVVMRHKDDDRWKFQLCEL